MHSFSLACLNWGVLPHGVIHMGVCNAQIVDHYAQCGIKSLLVVDPHPAAIQRRLTASSSLPVLKTVPVALGEVDGSGDFWVNTYAPASSMQPVARLSQIFPEWAERQCIQVPVRRLDALLEELELPASCNILSLNCPGGALPALAGARQTLASIDAIFAWVQLIELYQGVPLLDAMDEHLSALGYERAQLELPLHPTWGNAMYLRSKQYRSSSHVQVGIAEREFYTRYLQPGMVAFDVGANVGKLTRLFAKQVGKTGRVHAFEPCRSTFEKLAANCQQSPRAKFFLHCTAMADERGAKPLFIYPEWRSQWNGLSSRTGIAPPLGEELVPVDTLDNYCETRGVQRIHLLKIDTEGVELQVLRGAERLFRERRIDCCAFEFGETTFDAGNTPEQLQKFFDEFGYHLRNIIPTDPVFPRDPYRNAARHTMILARPRAEKRRLATMSTLGRNGRFANQLFQYMFLKIYAQQHDCQVETSPWVGQEIFDVQDSPVSDVLPQARERGEADPERLNDIQQPSGMDWCGFFQFHTRFYAPHQDSIRKMFKPGPRVRERVQQAFQQLRRRGQTTIGIQLRRGDYGYKYFYVAPSKWYLAWLEQIWPTLKDPVLFISSDEPYKVLGDFAAYAPVTSTDLGVTLDECPEYLDFYLLSCCDRVAISNSTYSFAACMLNSSATEFMRPVLSQQRLISFDPWDDHPILRNDLVEDFPNCDGIRHFRFASAKHVAKPASSARSSGLSKDRGSEK